MLKALEARRLHARRVRERLPNASPLARHQGPTKRVAHHEDEGGACRAKHGLSVNTSTSTIANMSLGVGTDIGTSTSIWIVGTSMSLPLLEQLGSARSGGSGLRVVDLLRLRLRPA